MNKTTPNCPSQDVWHDFLDDKGRGELGWDAETLTQHLQTCASCNQTVSELKRFRTLLLRSQVPGLDDEQWRGLDDRMQLMGSEFVPPSPRVKPMVWSAVAAAAIALVGMTAWQYFGPRTDRWIHSAGKSADLLAEQVGVGLAVGIVEGDLQIIDAAGAWHPLGAEKNITPGARLRSLSAARLTVPGHFELTMAPNTEIEATEIGPTATFLRLHHGEIGCHVNKRKIGQHFGVMSGSFRSQVIGTRFAVMHEPGGTVAIMVSEGAVRVDQADRPRAPIGETTSVVRAGNRWRASRGTIELGPIVPALKTAETRLESPKSPQLLPSPEPKRAASRSKTTPATKKPPNSITRNILINIPHQQMSAEEVAHLKAMERLLWGPSPDNPKAATPPTNPEQPRPATHEPATDGALEPQGTNEPDKTALHAAPTPKAKVQTPAPPPLAGAQPEPEQENQATEDANPIPAPPPLPSRAP